MPAAWRELVQKTLASRQSYGPVSVRAREAAAEQDSEWLVSTHAVEDVDRRLIGVMLTGRNLDALANVQSTLRYSSKLTALGRLSAGVAHEVKNPLNAMMIHLELLRQKLSGVRAGARGAARGQRPRRRRGARRRSLAVAPPVDVTGALDHVSVISNEIRRLDQVLQGFLRFTRPEDLRLQPVDPAALLEEVARVIQAEAPANGVRVEVNAPPTTPYVNGDAGMLRQAILNLALNACQAMPNGGVLRFGARRGARRGASSCRSRTPGPGSSRNTCSASSTCTSRRGRRARASGSRWCTVPCSCTTATSRSSRRRASARPSAC